MVAETGHPEPEPAFAGAPASAGCLDALMPGSLSAPDAALLLTLLETPGSVAEAAASRAIPADRLLALLSNTAAHEALDHLRAFAAIRRDLRADPDRDEAVSILLQVARATTDLVEKRLAAAAALRAIGSGRRSHSGAPRGPSPRVAVPTYPPGGGPRAAASRGVARGEGAATAAESLTVSPSHRITVSPSHSTTGSPSHRRRRTIRDLTPEEAERYLDRQKRENDRLEKLGQRAIAMADAALPEARPSVPLPPPPGPPPTGPFADDVAFARSIIHAVESGHPAAADYAGDVETARNFLRIFDRPPPEPANTS